MEPSHLGLVYLCYDDCWTVVFFNRKGCFIKKNYSSFFKSFITTFVLVSINLKGCMVSRVFTELANLRVAVKLFFVLPVVLNRLR